MPKKKLEEVEDKFEDDESLESDDFDEDFDEDDSDSSSDYEDEDY